MTISPRFFLVMLTASLAACSQPAIEKVGSGGGAGGGGGDNGGGRGGRTGGTDGPDFSVTYPDGGLADAAAVVDPIGEGQACASEMHEGKLVPLDLLMLIDISGSMEEAAEMKSKWTALHDALVTFIEDPKSAGLGVGLETFPPPSKKCNTTAECGAGGYCEEKGVCNAAPLVATTQQACNDVMECANGSPCTKYGICSASGLRCAAGGMPCGAGETCTPRPKFCVIPNAGCNSTAYETPIVAIADLPGAVPALTAAMAGIVPQGTTPTTPAVTGALAHLRMRAAANPARKQVLVLATDGLPTECAPNNSIDAAAAALGAAQMGTPAIPTYVIGVFGAGQANAGAQLMALATAGGTGMPVLLTAGNDLSQRFLETINQIRGAALGCEFAIPQPEAGKKLDFGKLNVRLSSKAGDEDLGYVTNAAACDPTKGGWYYDADPKQAVPTRVLLCDASCKKVKNTTDKVSVTLRVGCDSIVIK